MSRSPPPPPHPFRHPPIPNQPQQARQLPRPCQRGLRARRRRAGAAILHTRPWYQRSTPEAEPGLRTGRARCLGQPQQPRQLHLARAAVSQGNAEQRSATTRDLEIREALQKQNPDSAQAARDVMFSQYKLGELDAKLQRFESAIAHFGAGIAVLNGMIAKRLNEETVAATREKGILGPWCAVHRHSSHWPPGTGQRSSRRTPNCFPVC